ncbi:hypothetical protein ABT136_14675 [Streptomyces sp. NPDC001856]|uniref:hypothetical protein n=1 Tax=Streptomyces sp. NPDC001856 TaxID=3154399 RepID=UPI00331F078B
MESNHRAGCCGRPRSTRSVGRITGRCSPSADSRNSRRTWQSAHGHRGGPRRGGGFDMELLQHYEGLFLERAGIDGPQNQAFGTARVLTVT